jgi:hypothetical protein
MNETKSAGLRLPVQAAVNRTADYNALTETQGVDAAQINWGSLGQTVLQHLPGIISGIASFL